MLNSPKIIVTSPLSRGQDPNSDVTIWRYVESLQRRGAEPIVVAKGECTIRAFHDYDVRGILFSGGGDIDASRYNGRRELCKRVDSERDEGEIELFQEAYFNNVPILAICRGMQVANVALGGSLIEDVPSLYRGNTEVVHHCGADGPERFEHMHSIRCVPGSKLESIIKYTRIQVNSVHHQAVERLAPQLMASGYSDDGIIEAIEPQKDHPGFFLGVQWHPEALPSDDGPSRAIFETFVTVCRGIEQPVTS